MKTRIRVLILCALSLLIAATPPAYAQGKGNDKGQQGNAKGGKQQDKGPKQSQAKPQSRGGNAKHNDVSRGAAKAHDDKPNHADKSDKSDDESFRGNGEAKGGSRNFKRVVQVNDFKPNLRRFATSNRVPERIAAGALGRGIARGLRDDDVVIRENGNRISLLNRSGVVLVDLDDERARNLGGWRVQPYDDDVKSGAPAFCRSGEGHPVWGREWCVNKGFGLGDYRDVRWGRTTDVRDIIFRPNTDRATLARDVLIGVLGDVVFNRLGLHSLTLGYSEPLTGVWLGEPTGPRVLRLSSGGYPVAEIYDGDRDNRADALVVALKAW
jgi:hypothetical protein